MAKIILLYSSWIHLVGGEQLNLSPDDTLDIGQEFDNFVDGADEEFQMPTEEEIERAIEEIDDEELKEQFKSTREKFREELNRESNKKYGNVQQEQEGFQPWMVWASLAVIGVTYYLFFGGQSTGGGHRLSSSTTVENNSKYVSNQHTKKDASDLRAMREKRLQALEEQRKKNAELVAKQSSVTTSPQTSGSTIKKESSPYKEDKPDESWKKTVVKSSSKFAADIVRQNKEKEEIKKKQQENAVQQQKAAQQKARDAAAEEEAERVRRAAAWKASGEAAQARAEQEAKEKRIADADRSKRLEEERKTQREAEKAQQSLDQAPTDGSFTLVAKIVGKPDFILSQCRPEQMVQTIRDRIADKYNLNEEDNIRIIFSGRSLKLDQTLESYKMMHRGVLMVVLPKSAETESTPTEAPAQVQQPDTSAITQAGIPAPPSGTSNEMFELAQKAAEESNALPDPEKLTPSELASRAMDAYESIPYTFVPSGNPQGIMMYNLLKQSLEKDITKIDPFLLSIYPTLKYVIAYEPTLQQLLDHMKVVPGQQTQQPQSSTEQASEAAPDLIGDEPDDADLYG